MKSKGMKGLPTVGGWNKGLRYGEIVSPEALTDIKVAVHKTVKCTCGTCRKCRHRMYSRVWSQQRQANLRKCAETTDAELDAKAAKWLSKIR